MPRYSQQDKQDAREWFLEHVKPGDTINCILRHVSRSGMRREIGLVIIMPDGSTRHPNHSAAVLLDLPMGKRDSVKVDGCGMDMGFHLVYNLGAALWPDGTPEPHGTRNGEPDSDGGYALNHRWL